MNKAIKKATAWRGVPLILIAASNNCQRQFHFVSERFNNPEDLKSSGFQDEECIIMHPKFNWANIAATIELFSSVGVAKKSGWDIPIEDGFTEAFFSKSDGTPLFVFIIK